MKTYVHSWEYVAEFLLKWEILQINFVEKIETHFMTKNFFFWKSFSLWNNVEKYGRARQVTDEYTILRMRFAFWLTKATDIYSQYVILLPFGAIDIHERVSMLHLH